MQRFFSTFPGRWPGIGLFLLRCLLGIVATWQAGAYLGHAVIPAPLVWGAAALAPLAGVLLVTGALTPASSTVAALSLLMIMINESAAPTRLLPLDGMSTGCMVTVALALILLGPGAYSIDARWFGRREIVFSDTPQPRG